MHAFVFQSTVARVKSSIDCSTFSASIGAASAMLTVGRTQSLSSRDFVNEIRRYIKELDALEIDELLDRLSKTPNDVVLLDSIGCRYLTAGQLDKSEEYFNLAITLDPSHAWTYLFVGYLHYARHQYHKAIESFLRATELAPDAACPYWCLADAYEQSGNAELANRHYKKAVSVEPQSLEARRHLDQWYERRYTPD